MRHLASIRHGGCWPRPARRFVSPSDTVAYICSLVFLENVLLPHQRLFPVIRLISGNMFIIHLSAGQCSSTPCWKDNRPVTDKKHLSGSNRLRLLHSPGFTSPHQSPPCCPDLNSADYKISAVMQQRVYQTKIRRFAISMNCDSVC